MTGYLCMRMCISMIISLSKHSNFSVSLNQNILYSFILLYISMIIAIYSIHSLFIVQVFFLYCICIIFNFIVSLSQHVLYY